MNYPSNGREADVAPQVEKTNVLFLVLSRGPSQYPPMHDAFPCRVSALWMAPQWAEAQPAGSHKLRNVLVLALEKKRKCVYRESLRGGTSDLCVLRIPGLPGVYGELYQKKRGKKMLKLGHWLDGFLRIFTDLFILCFIRRMCAQRTLTQFKLY